MRSHSAQRPSVASYFIQCHMQSYRWVSFCLTFCWFPRFHLFSLAVHPLFSIATSMLQTLKVWVWFWFLALVFSLTVMFFSEISPSFIWIFIAFIKMSTLIPFTLWCAPSIIFQITWLSTCAVKFIYTSYTLIVLVRISIKIRVPWVREWFLTSQVDET